MMVLLLLFQDNFRHAQPLLANALNIYIFFLLTSRSSTLIAIVEMIIVQQSILRHHTKYCFECPSIKPFCCIISMPISARIYLFVAIINDGDANYVLELINHTCNQTLRIGRIE